MTLHFLRPTRLNAGQALGPYLIADKLGEGGMGLVYKATDQRTGTEVALKLLRQRFNTGHREALVDEARAAAKLNSPHCVKLFDAFAFGSEQQPVLVYEYVAGCDLRTLLESELLQADEAQGLSPLAACLVFEQCLRGVRAAHVAQLVHQDLKPENFLVEQWLFDRARGCLDDEGRPDMEALESLLWEHRERAWIKLADWGMALIREDSESFSQSLSLSFTHIPENKRGGTLVYMPPEQIDGQGISRRTDVFALGLILCELLTGRSALSARLSGTDTELNLEDPQALLVQLLSGQSESALDLDSDSQLWALKRIPALSEMLTSMTLYLKRDRWESRQVQEYLTELLDDPQALQMEPTRSLAGLIMLGLSVSLLTLGVGLGIWLWVPPKGRREPPQAQSSTGDQADKAPKANDQSALIARIIAGDWAQHSQVQSLTPELLEALIRSPIDNLIFEQLETLSLAEAEILTRFEGRILDFPKLTSAPKDVLKTLAKCECERLKLSALEQVSAKQCFDIKDFKGQLLILGGRELGAEHLQALAQYRGRRIELSQWRNPSKEALLEFAEFRGRALGLDAVESLNPEWLRPLLKRKSIKELSMNGLKELSPGLLKVLTDAVVETVSFNSIKAIDINVAKALQGFSVRARFISLAKLESLSQALLQAWSPQNTRLTMVLGLRELSFSEAQTLSLWQLSNLRCHSLESLTQGAWRQLGLARIRTFELGLPSIEAFLVKDFKGQKRRTVILKNVQRLPADVTPLPKKAAWSLSLPSLIVSSVEELRAARSLRLRVIRVDGRVANLAMAKELSKRRTGTLVLTHSQELSPEFLRALEFKGRSTRIEFEDLSRLPVNLAKAMVDYETHVLNFKDLRTMSAEAAQYLTRCRCHNIVLNGLFRPGEGCGDVLGRFQGLVTLTRKYIVDKELVRLLTVKKPPTVKLQDVRVLSVEGAAELARFQGRSVSVVARDLDPKAARELSRYQGRLAFFGLRHMSPELSQALSEYQGEVLDIACESFAPSAFAALKSYHGRLYLRMPLHVSTQQSRDLGQLQASELEFGGELSFDLADDAEYLAAYKNRLIFAKAERWTPELCRALSKFQGQLLLIKKMQSWASECFDKLAPMRCQRLSLPLTNMNAQTARALSRSQCQHLTLERLSTIDGATLSVLARYQGALKFRCVGDFQIDWAMALTGFKGTSLELPYRSFSNEALVTLKHLKCRRLILPSFFKLPSGMAARLREFECRGLSLNALKTLTVDDAKALSGYPGHLSLAMPLWIKELDILLKSYRGTKLEFTQLKEVSDLQAKQLLNFRGQVLKLPNLERASASSLALLTAFPGELQVHSKLEAAWREAQTKANRER